MKRQENLSSDTPLKTFRHRTCKKTLFWCESCAGVHVPLLGWYPIVEGCGSLATALLLCHPSLSPSLLFCCLSLFLPLPWSFVLRGFLQQHRQWKWKVQASGGKMDSRLQSDTQGDTRRYPEDYHQMVKIARSPSCVWEAIDLLFIPFSVLTSRACKIPSGRNCIEKSFLASFEPVSGQSPGVEGYGEAANSMVRKAEATHPWKGQRARKQVLDEKNKES